MVIKDLIQKGDKAGVEKYLNENLLNENEIDSLKSFAEGAKQFEIHKFLDTQLFEMRRGERKDSDSSGKGSMVSQYSNTSSIPDVDYDISKATKYLEEMEVKYTEEEIKNFQDQVQSLFTIIQKAPKFDTGFKQAMKAYHKIQDEHYFVITFLLQSFLEEFVPDKYYTEDLRNKDFACLVDYASHEIGEQQFHSLLGYDSQIHIQ